MDPCTSNLDGSGNFRLQQHFVRGITDWLSLSSFATFILELQAIQAPPTHLLRKLITVTMKFSILACGLLASLSSVVSGTALTYKLNANEKACFFSYVDHPGAKIAFYFAVSAPTPIGLC